MNATKPEVNIIAFPFAERSRVKTEIKTVIETAARLESCGAAARSLGNESSAEKSFQEALRLAAEVADAGTDEVEGETVLDILRMTVRLALSCGEVRQARRWLEHAFAASPAITQSEEWSPFSEVTAWKDEWLVAAVRRDPPDMAALDALAVRYWKEVFARCYLLTLDREKASDLAQQSWSRVLRARRRLLPGGNFPAYLATVATNLWRDSQRWSRRAGPIAEQNVLSLDEPILAYEDENVLMADALPSPNSPNIAERAMLKFDLDQALAGLSPKLRDVLIARFIAGESCAEIARRYGRTEQTVSGWVREAIREMKSALEEWTSLQSSIHESSNATAQL